MSACKHIKYDDEHGKELFKITIVILSRLTWAFSSKHLVQAYRAASMALTL